MQLDFLMKRSELTPLVKEMARLELGLIGPLDEHPLFYCISWNRAIVFRCLLETGATPNVRGKYGKTPLMAAVDEDLPEFVLALLDTGRADPALRQ